jgi:hypothetical protein
MINGMIMLTEQLFSSMSSETGTGQQVAQLHERYMMIVSSMIMLVV